MKTYRIIYWNNRISKINEITELYEIFPRKLCHEQKNVDKNLPIIQANKDQAWNAESWLIR